MNQNNNSPGKINRIIFMGTPEFAVPSLDALIKAGFQVVGVVTAADKPAGRGMKLTESAVKKYALAAGLKVLQPEKLKDPQFLASLKSLNADLQVVVAFRMLPESVWNMPPGGTINLHGSLLPQYRGAAPINWAIINGEKETGVTTFKLQQEIDTGNILLNETIPISEDETAGELHDRMKEIGAALIVKTLEGISDNTLKEKPQPDQAAISSSNISGVSGNDSLKKAPKIFTETCQINWNKSCAEIHNLIRGLSPFPAAFTRLDGNLLKIFRSKKEITTAVLAPGLYQTDHKTYLKFACADGYISILEVQMEGKKKMPIEDFLRGYRIAQE
jgi:methionyl-tRNA formyltransferase